MSASEARERPNPRFVSIADDLTGALEVGSVFAARAIPSMVTMACSFAELPADASGVDALVFDTETRHATPAEASSRVAQIARECRTRGVRCVFKKTDSTLRGNIGPEVGALLASGLADAIFYAPAYPKLGRTVRDGRLYIDGVPLNRTAFAGDPFEPATHSEVARVLARDVRSRVISVGAQVVPASGSDVVFVFDGETDEDVQFVAAMLAEKPGWIAAGPAGLAHEIASIYGAIRPPEPIHSRRCLVVNGSLHPAAKKQIETALHAGWPCIDEEELPSVRADPEWLVFRQPADTDGATLQHAARPAPGIVNLIDAAQIDTLVVFGGDTAFAILSALGCRDIDCTGEIIPGIPLSRLIWRPPRAPEPRYLTLLTKAGGFGQPDTLLKLRQRLTSRPHIL